MRSRRTLTFGGLGAAAGALIIAGAAFALDPSGSPSPAPEASASAAATQTPTPTPTPAVLGPQSTAVAPVATAKATEKPEASETPDIEPATQTLSGTLTKGTDADGDPAYFIGTTRLGVGPPWFWGDKNPLAAYVGKSVTITGHMDDGKPESAKANAKAKAGDGPEFEAYTVNGATIRAPGKPPWAGGPKAVGEKHPGYKGWSQGQTDKDKGAKGAPTPTPRP